MRPLRKCTRVLDSICMLLMLCCSHTASAMDCSSFTGCMACTEQLHPTFPTLPPGYKINPQLLAPQAPSSQIKSPNLQTGTAAPAEAAATVPTAQSKITSAVAALKAAGTAWFGRKRSLLESISNSTGKLVSSAFVGVATPAESAITGVSVSTAEVQQAQEQQQQQLIPQLPVPSTPATLPGASTDGIQTGTNSNGQRMVHAAAVPITMAIPVESSAVNSVPLMFPTMPQQQAMNILKTDPRDVTGPHPWDVLLFRTNQFNTSKPAYRLGGLGLMLMSDFNRTQPLTDWHILQQAQPAVQSSSTATNPLKGFGGLMSHKLASFADTKPQFGPKFSSFFKPSTAVHPDPSAVSAASTASVLGAGSADGSSMTGVQLRCTACQAPAYQLSAYGYCVCSPGYGRLIDSHNPYACSKCPSGQVAATATPSRGPTNKPVELKLQTADTLDVKPEAADRAVLSICQPCPKAAVPNALQTACVAP